MTDKFEYNVLTGDWYNIYFSDCAFCDLRKENFSTRFLCSDLDDEVPVFCVASKVVLHFLEHVLTIFKKDEIKKSNK